MLATKLSNSTGLPELTDTRCGLLVKIHPLQGVCRPFELGAMDYVLGRDESCHLKLDDDAVSRRHATIESFGEQYVIRDLDSTNGTFVNEEPISCCMLRSGDRIRLGKQIFKYVAGDEIESQYHEVMFQYAVSDGLTQLNNKRFFSEIMTREVAACRRRREPLSVLIMDLDKFKSINDTHGHLAGDAVLVEFAKRAASQLRSGELLARFGGEEFAVMCSGSEVNQAVQLAERIRLSLAQSPVKFEELQIPVTVSIGVAGTLSDNDTPATLLQRADECLYRAKESGRNQTQCQSSEAA